MTGISRVFPSLKNYFLASGSATPDTLPLLDDLRGTYDESDGAESETSSNRQNPGGENEHKQDSSVEKLHACQQCGRGLSRPYNLKVHAQTHQPARDRPFVCGKCGQTFTRSHELSRHEKVGMLACLCNTL